MKYGIAMFPTEDGLAPTAIAALVENLGFESLFFPEHTHIPASRESHFDPEADELGSEYSRTFDPFVALTAAAAATSRLKLGTGICLVVQRDPIATAKSVASLDVISGGRVLFGVGAGWNREEMRNHGTDPRTRMRLLVERVAAMKEIWTEEEASFSGEFVEFDRIWSWPKPAQKPHPPILVGGTGRTVLDRVLAIGDEWLPEPEPGLVGRIGELRRRAADAGREIKVTLYSAEPDDLEDYTEAGVHRAVFFVAARDPVAATERIAALADALQLTRAAAKS